MENAGGEMSKKYDDFIKDMRDMFVYDGGEPIITDEFRMFLLSLTEESDVGDGTDTGVSNEA